MILKIIIPVIIFVIILVITGIFFLNQPKHLAAMADGQIPEDLLIIHYEDAVYEEILKELPENFLNSDNDKDGINNKEEIDSGLSPYTEDSDNDGICNYEEINTYKSDPLKCSTADDGVSDLGVKHLDVSSPIQNYQAETIIISDEVQLAPEDIILKHFTFFQVITDEPSIV